MNTAPSVLLKKGAWFTLAAAADALRKRELAPDESYFDTERRIWIPLGRHPGIHKLVLPPAKRAGGAEDSRPTLLKKGAWLSLGGLVEALRRHEVSLDDHYYDPSRKAWTPLNSHPRIKKQLLPIPKKLLGC
jgi:hypothetical protein